VARRAQEAGVLNLVVISHKPCWPSGASASGFATDGGFPIQMRALSELFDRTVILVPSFPAQDRTGELPLTGRNLVVVALSRPPGQGLWRKLLLVFWLFGSGRVLIREVRLADAVHAPIPGDIGTVGIVLALLLRKPLFVRHCGNWFGPRTVAERFWKWLLERLVNRRQVVFATGGSSNPPSRLNPSIGWIFATTLTEEELRSSYRLRVRLPGDGPRLVIACRQEKDKGTGVLIESLALIRKTFSGATLDVLGDGSALREFRQLAVQLGVDRYVVFHGKVDHAAVLGRLREADLFCYPTMSSDGFPKVVVEALAAGLPVVTTRVSVLPHLIESAGCGRLLEEVTPATLAEGVRACLSDQQAYRSMSANALEAARAYSLERWKESIGRRLAAAWGPLQSGG
jgi:glycosyltransferase involved in cell wall biosynthesis